MLINQSTLINLFLFVYYSIYQSENLVTAILFTIQNVQSKFQLTLLYKHLYFV